MEIQINRLLSFISLLLGVILLLGGCSFRQVWTPYVVVSQNRNLPLFAAEQYGETYSATYHVVYEKSELSYPLLVQLEVEGSRLSIAGISEFGLRLFLIQYVDGNLNVDSPRIYNLPFNPLDMVISLQFAILDEVILPEEFSLAECASLDGECLIDESQERLLTITNNPNPILVIRQSKTIKSDSKGHTSVENLHTGYLLEVEKLYCELDLETGDLVKSNDR